VRHALVLGVAALLLSACGSTAPARRSDASPSTASPTPATPVHVEGTFEKWTNFPCHRSDPYVGGNTVVFHASDGTDTTVVTGSANWIGRPADPPTAPLGQCHEVAPFVADLPRAASYVVEIDNQRLAPVTLRALRSDGFRHRFVLP
jgi:hypothetical protein